ncbi:hypothetical protein SELMODRAFT_230362 [Selaginella moellendorffii]|uniref:Aminotransferase class I/classII large domain-containing protein n=1 Tax=Selaginella moellendorffii TaxID=88036 RepID=D8QZT7_SELML|nr:uncharacterized protein LOC9654683 isoform X2 [Selaginella moellendorffii]EFJ34854.1 hypothetical protein SELMODRAFT_230362 [Selaginella moellendorffii]|eukprot:XP_002964521.1 uncharacterized protein LOC9654683 isoform X2 [Selaginella moellendorffii]
MEEEGFCRWLAHRTRSFKPSPIQKLSHLAQQRNAINLAEGFPDFPAPPEVKEAARDAIGADFNQYRHVQGVCDKVAEHFEHFQGVKVDSKSDIVLCCGQSEALAAATFAVVDRDDEVILLEPVYETYESCIIMAGGKPVFVPLTPPLWTLDSEKLERSITSRTKAIVINSPHNPTGKVFAIEELKEIAQLCCKHDLLAITDEVYEHIVFPGATHVSIASLPGMLERTIVTSSISKTYSVTGWRVGWAIAPVQLASAIRNIHVKLTDSAPSPFQVAALVALQSSHDFYAKLKSCYRERGEYIKKVLVEAGFEVPFTAQGSFFVFARLPDAMKQNDIEFVTDLINRAGVALVPGSAFFRSNKLGYENRYVRVAFCKEMATLVAAERALKKAKLFAW